MGVAPSGRQYSIHHGQARAVLVEAGGGVRSLVVAGRELLDGYGEHERVTAARGQPLIPWPNRLADGAYSWQGRGYRTALTEPELGNALHGFTRHMNWDCLALSTSRCELGLTLYPQLGYPFVLGLRVVYELSASGELTVTTRARNLGDEAAPYAHGQHPYLVPPAGRLDECTLTVPAGRYLPTDDRMIPTGVAPVDGTPFDFRSGRPLGGLALDYAFTDLARDAGGRAWVRLRGPDGGGAELWVDETYPYVELFTGDTLPEASRRRQGLGVEPMTCPPNGFASGTDLIGLEPGDAVTTTWGLRPLAP